jgi:hypothetical protein
LLRSLTQIERTIVAIGSHDMILDLAASQLRAGDPKRVARIGQRRIHGRVDRAARRPLSPRRVAPARSGEGAYTLPYVDQILAGREIAVVRLVHREQGLLVAPGNPLGLNGVADLARPGLRHVNRQRGAGTRVLLDYELARAGILPDAVVRFEVIPGHAVDIRAYGCRMSSSAVTPLASEEHTHVDFFTAEDAEAVDLPSGYRRAIALWRARTS